MANVIAKDLEKYANEHGEPHWLVQRRLDALTKIDQLPDFSVSESQPAVDIAMRTPQKTKLTKEMLKLASVDEDEIGLVQIGQSSLENTLDEDDEDAGVILTDIFTAFRQHPRLIEKYFMNKILKTDQDKQSAQHVALLNSGAFLYIPKNYQLNDTVIINMIQDSLNDQPMITHLFIYADEGSKVSVVQNLATIGEQENPCDCVVEILARPKSQVEFFGNDHLGTKTSASIRRMAQVSRDAQVNWQIGSHNLGSCRQLVESNLAHQSAKSNIKLMSLQTDESKLAIKAVIQAKDVENATDNQILQISNADHLKLIDLSTHLADKDGRDKSAVNFDSERYTADQVALTTSDNAPDVRYDPKQSTVQRFYDSIADFIGNDFLKIVKNK